MAKDLGGFGEIVHAHDEMGCFLAAKCGHLVDVFSPLQAEATAIREGWFGRYLGDIKTFYLSPTCFGLWTP